MATTNRALYRSSMQHRSLQRGLAVAVGIAMAGVVTSFGPSQAPVQAQPKAAQATGMGVAKAAAAAETILDVIQNGDAKARFQLFSDDLKAATSPALVARNMARQPKILSWRITSVDAGLRNATVDAQLQTSKGAVAVVLIINNQGQLVAYQVDESAESSTQVARDFTTAVINGQFVQARSFLSLTLQNEISPQALQGKWLNLQRETGNFVRLRRIVEAERSEGVRIVLVNLEFTRLADTLFVILDDRNQITGLDFPNEPAVVNPR